MPDLFTTCLTPDDISRLLDARIPEEELSSVRQHLMQCPACRQQLDDATDQPELESYRPATPVDSQPEQRPPGRQQETRLQAMMATLKSQLPHGVRRRFNEASDVLETLSAPVQERSDLPVVPHPFRVVRELGRGGMGVVYLGEDLDLNRQVAIKILRADRGDAQARARFVREGQAAARLRHPHVATVYAAHNPVDGPACLVMEYVSGPSLKELIEQQTVLAPSLAADLMQQICSGVQHAHTAGLIHRDLKPGNVLLRATPESDSPAWQALVMDFGLVRITDGQSPLITTDPVAGTPAYMSPEQVTASRDLDVRTDVYSLGVTFYEMLTGTVPFIGTTQMVLTQILEANPRPPRRLNDSIPRDLETICLKAMHVSPARRYASPAELAADLSRWQRGEPILARPVGPAGRFVSWCRRSPRLAAATGTSFLLLALLAGGATVAALRIRSEQHVSDGLRNKAETALTAAQLATTDALQSKDRADRSAQAALDAYNHLVVSVQRDLKGHPRTLALRRSLLEKALPGLEQIVGTSTGADTASHSLLTALLRHGEVVWYLGRTDQAITQYEQCRRLAEERLLSDPLDLEIRFDLALALEQLGVIAQHSGQRDKARQFYQQFLSHMEQLAMRAPDTTEYDGIPPANCVGPFTAR
jgi:anti-sigma factor RsiW